MKKIDRKWWALGIGLAGAIFTTQLARDSADALYQGISMGFLVAAGVALLGIVSSAMKDESIRN